MIPVSKRFRMVGESMASGGRGGERLFSPRFVSLFLIHMLLSAGFYMTMPTLPKYAVSIGMTLTEAGVLTGIFSIAAIFSRPFAGLVADRHSKKWVLFWITVGMMASTVGYSITSSRAGLYAWRIIHGATFAGSSTIQLALAAGVVPEKRRGEGLGYMGMVQVLAMSFAPSLGLWFSERFGYSAMFWLAAGLIGCAAAGLLLLRFDEAPGRAARRGVRLRDLFAVELALFALMGSLFSMSNGITTSYLSMLADERAIAGVGLFFTVSSVAVLVSKPFSGRLMDRRGIWMIMAPCLAFGAAAMFLIAGARGLWPLLLAAALKGVAQSSGQSALQAECANRSGALRTGVAMSTCYLGNDLGQGLGNALGGALSARLGYAAMFAIVGATVLTGYIMMAAQRGLDRARAARAMTKGEREHA